MNDVHVQIENICYFLALRGRPATPRACKRCHGTGRINKRCDECEGTGEIECTCSSCGNIHERSCQVCGGQGRLYPDEKCDVCDGLGVQICNQHHEIIEDISPTPETENLSLPFRQRGWRVQHTGKLTRMRRRIEGN